MAFCKLTDISRPIVASQVLHGRRRKPRDILFQFFVVLLGEEIGEGEDILFAFPKGWRFNRYGVQAIEQIFAKMTLGDGLVNVLVRGRDNSYVDLDGLHPTQPLKFLFLKNTEDLGLGAGAHIPNFVEEKSSSARLLEAPDPLTFRSRKCPLFVPKQFAFEQIFLKRGTIDLHKALLGSKTVVMNQSRNEFFSCPRFACNENGCIAFCNLPDDVQDLLDLHTVADNIVVFEGNSGLAS